MAPIRFRTRHLHATFYNHVRLNLATLGWVSAPVNFGALPLNFMDYQPDERAAQIKYNTLAVSIGDYSNDDDEELGATGGGLRSASYDVYMDVYMEEQALSLALCDDIRDLYTDFSMPLVDQINQQVVPNTLIEIEAINGPERPGSGPDQFRKYWRTMRLEVVLFFQSA
jgi:hypothetical protein